MSRRRSQFATTTAEDLRQMLLAQQSALPVVECGYDLGRGRSCHGHLGRAHTHATRCPAFAVENDERGE